ncbi:endonuclease/exonuclease/phosphatase family protein [Adhaeribacter rhizoryzae]|uniref:Endonuclease/exonuclease/phosphatase family protein n=1 Tax=Adhaeribacter rhizoryzae TaxID=2607907 RepID=A0A5M6DMT3_9BACT|nr:endonuclease/exonuclease/phosphatase family protein [Adhaeribacter rhizoryzae]KAA5547549.1 endonuclease/exonuclease/phosphatase family protein [Adhaeribacter rhizoryzae]
MLAIFCLYVSPETFWPAAFIALTLPGALLLNILFLLIWVFNRSFKAILPLLVIVFSWNYYERGFAINLSPNNELLDVEPQMLQVLSYNVRIFNTYAHLQDENQQSSKKMIKWVASHPADIFCLQEFYNETRSPVYNTTSKIGKQHQKRFYIAETLVNGVGAQFGLAIFSKFPIVGKGIIRFREKTNNLAMFIDVKLEKDTVRVYNFHFQSMSIEEKDIVDTYQDQDKLTVGGRKLLRQFKRGVVKRADQVNLLLEHAAASPYPVILCGDTNDLPYSYTYQRLKSEHTNAFQAKGWGIGATYNGKLPFVRIDNQFCDDRWEVLNYSLHDTIPYSDHFPITATFKLVNK